MTIEDTLEESDRAIENYFKRKKAETMAKSPYSQGVAAGSSETGNANKFEHQLEGQEGQGIGDIYANQQLAQLNVAAEQGQAKVVGEEATIAETRRLLLEEEASFMPPSKIGPDKNGNYMRLLDYKVTRFVVGGKKLYQLTATYGERFWQSMEDNNNVRQIDRDSLIDNIYEHARRIGTYFGNGLERNLLNPGIVGKDLTLTIYGSYRRELIKGAFTGTRAELYTSAVSEDRVKGILAALEPESVSARAKEQEEG